MITYDQLAATPKAFPALTGLTRAEFDRLFREFAAAADVHRAARTHTKRRHRRLRRAAGGRHPHHLDPPTPLLLALVGLRGDPTYEPPRWLVRAHQYNARANAPDVP